jgi:hypothetical protein
LTFDSSLTAAGRITRGDDFYAPNTGTVKIKNAAGAYVNMTTANDGIQELAGYSDGDLSNPAKGDGLPNPVDTWKEATDWKQGALDLWNGKVRDKAQGVQMEAPPPVQSIDRGGYYETKAGLKILTNAGGTTYITKQDGTVINATSLGANNPVSTSTFYNGRERKSVTVTNVDMGKLTAAGLYPTNGLVYASRADAVPDANPNDTTADNARRPNGIRLTNAAVLPGPMTMVTNDPLYIKGDFNIHRDAAGKVPGQAGYNAATDTWKPAATMADATTILSNGFSDAANASSNNKSASASAEVNTVLISGYHNSNATEGWSGGMHNFPRLLENWSGKTLKMRGSMIELWQSKFATGSWSTSPPTGFDYYTPPTRDWGIDSAFGGAVMPPAFTELFPSTTRSVTQRKWQQLQPDEALLSV